MEILYRNITYTAVFKNAVLQLKTSRVLLVMSLLILSQAGYAKAGKTVHRRQAIGNRHIKKNFDGGPSVSYSTPQIYTAGQAVASAPTSNAISPYQYDLYGNKNVIAPILSAQITAFDIITDAAVNLYVSQTGEVDKILTGSFTVQTIASGFNNLSDIAIHASGNLFAADYGANQVVKIPAGTSNKVVIGTGILGPAGIAVDPAGNVYVSEYNAGDVKKIQAGTNTTTVIGTGFNDPWGLALDVLGNLYVADSGNNVIKEINADGATTTVPFQALGVGLSLPSQITIDAAGTLFVEAYNAFGQNNLIVYKHLAEANQPEGGFDDMPNLINGVAIDGSGNVYVASADAYLNNSGIIKYLPEGGYFINRSLPAGITFDSETGVISGTALATNPSTNYTVTACNVDTLGNQTAVTATVNITVNAATAPAIHYVIPQACPINASVNINPVNTGGAVGSFVYYPTATKIGTGFNRPNGVAKDGSGNIYVADNGDLFLFIGLYR